MTIHITVVDYGMANLLNVVRALNHCGATVTVTEDPTVALAADRLVVPGVGAFKDSIHELHARGLDDAIRRYTQQGRPFLGICVGMQILFDDSEEFGLHPGLGILPGHVKRVSNKTTMGEVQRIPYIGWYHLVEPQGGRNWQDTLLQPVVKANPAFYFVHSFAAQPTNESDRLADYLYGGHRISAAVQRGNIMATQFHPERSAQVGLSLLKRFFEV